MFRVAQFTDSFLPIIDGVGRVVFNYASEISMRGHETYVVCPMFDSGYRGGYPFEIVDYVSVKPLKNEDYRVGLANADIHYTARLKMLKLDIIHAHSPGTTGIEAIRVARKMKVPVVGTFHSKYYDDLYSKTDSAAIATIGARFVSEFYNLCDEVWTVSHNAADTLHSYGYKREIKIVPNGSDPYAIHPEDEKRARDTFALRDDETVLLYTGQINFKKNLRLILEACALLKKRGERFRLVFAGAGPDEDEVRRLADELGIGDIFLMTGRISDQSLLLGLYAASTLFMFPSLYDTAGLVVREAAAMKTPSVVVRGSAPAEVIEDGITGFLCDDSAESLADAVSGALTDKKRLCEISAAARKAIPLPWDDVMDDVLRRYEAIIENYGKE